MGCSAKKVDLIIIKSALCNAAFNYTIVFVASHDGTI